jgi:3-hydroxymyristoyl/3-hydroxydecanoyl-(acyl carrier protein) dehydratase
MWHTITEITTLGDGTAEAQVKVPVDSPWFDGHFPGMPLLPGIAQLAMVEGVIGQAWEPERRAAQFTRVRFKLKIAPGTPVTVKVTPGANKPDTFAFQIDTPEGIACVGNVGTRTAVAT